MLRALLRLRTRAGPARAHPQIMNRAQQFFIITLDRPACCSGTVLTTRTVSTKTPEVAVVVEDTFIKKFFKKVGWLDHMKTRLKLSGYFLYECIPAKVSYAEWLTELELPDTFTSWFSITEIHVWLLMVRCMAEDAKNSAEGGDGRVIRNCIVEALWADVGNRIKLLEGVNPSIARKQVSELSEQFQAALVGYDEGLSDDRVLAGAVWRRLFHMRKVDAEHVEKVVKFIRRQIVELEKISSIELRTNPEITFLSITEA